MPEPEYRNVAFMLHATIRNRIDITNNVIDSVVDDIISTHKLSDTEHAILKHLQVTPELSAKELALLLHRTPRTIQRDINLLKRKGILQREGSDRNGKWIIL